MLAPRALPRCAATALILATVSGCGGTSTADRDASATDGAIPPIDGSAIDGSAIDGSAIDGSAIDGDAIDGGLADGGIPLDAASLQMSAVTVTAHPENVLVCFVTWTTNLPANSKVEFGETTSYDLVIGSDELVTSHNVLVIGMHAETQHHLRARSATASESVSSGDLTFTTGTLPESIPEAATGAYNAAEVQPGWTILNAAGSHPPTAVIYDFTGQPVWYYTQDVELSGGVALNVFYYPADRTISLGPSTPVIPALEIDLAGNTLWTGPLGTVPTRFHHHFEKLSDGTWVTLRRKTVDTVAGDIVQIIDSDHNVVWSWDVFDYLTPGTGDWTHCNGVDVDLTNQHLYLNSRSLSTVYKIDIASGDILWQLGAGGDFTNDQELAYPWFDSAHSPKLLSNGNIMVYDNGLSRGWTRAIEYELDVVEMKATVVWEFPGDATGLDPWYTTHWDTPRWGDADRLANGNTLMTAGAYATDHPSRIFEVTAGREVVWEMVITPTGDVGTAVYRADRMPALAQPL